MNTTKIPIDKYSTFGLQENWLINYLEFPKNWDEGLGVKKIPAFRRWLEDSNLMEKKAPTKLYHLITKRDLLLIWQIIFINLSYGSEIVKWYTTLEFKTWGIQELLDILDSTYYHKRTSLNNPLKAMINIFNNSEVLTNENILGNLKKKGNTFVSLERIKSNNISPIALVYCLYKFAEQNEYYDLSLNELYRDDMEHTPYKIFGIEKEEVKRILTGLQDNKNGILRVEFAASLDNIYLNKDFKSLDVLEIMLEG